MDEDIRQRLEGRRYAEAFELVLDRYEDKIFRLAFSMMRNEAQARDATQEVFVRIWKGLPGYHAGRALSTWIYTITRNTCFTELKKRSTRRTVSLQEPNREAVANCIPALQSADPEPGREMDVAAMLSELPENYRRVITLFSRLPGEATACRSAIPGCGASGAMPGLPHVCPATRATRCRTGARSKSPGVAAGFPRPTPATNPDRSRLVGSRACGAPSPVAGGVRSRAGTRLRFDDDHQRRTADREQQ